MGLIIGIIVVVIVGSILVGEADQTQATGSGGGVDQGTGGDCQGCQAAAKWYRSLPWWKKGAYAAWWAYKKAQCALSGCSF